MIANLITMAPQLLHVIVMDSSLSQHSKMEYPKQKQHSKHTLDPYGKLHGHIPNMIV